MPRRGQKKGVKTRPKRVKTSGWKKAKYTCASCHKHLPSTSYNDEALEKLVEREESHNAVCLDCSKELEQKIGSFLLKCNVCQRTRERAEFSTAMQKIVKDRKTKQHPGLRCLACQYPTCSQCKQPTTGQLRTLAPKTLQDVENFVCDQCRYPPCNGCKKAMTKRERQNHKERPWFCASCQQVRQHGRDLVRHAWKRESL